MSQSIALAEQLLDYGEKPPNDLLRKLIDAAAGDSDVELFAQAVNVCVRGGIQFDEIGFAALVGRLFAREAPHAQIRCAMNFGLEKDAEVLPLVPLEVEKDADRTDCFRGSTNDDSGEVGLDELSPLGSAPRPPHLEFYGSTNAPSLNGLYQLKAPRRDLLGHDRPIYERRLAMTDRYCVYYWDASLPETKDDSWPSGWYVGSEVGGGGVIFARCLSHGQSSSSTAAQATSAPPDVGNWEVKTKNGFRTPDARAKALRTASLNEVETESALSLVDLEAMKGATVGQDPRTSKYFCHFFVLLALEHLAEIKGFRVKWGFRSVDELVGFGLCFKDIKVETVKPPKESTKVNLPGWPETATQIVFFLLPRGTTEGGCRFKSAESVIISWGDPLKARLCEGSVSSIDFRSRQLTVKINGTMPEDPYSRFKYRIDNYANRTSYERQVVALLEFTAMERNKICELLVTAAIGKVDLAVLGGDGFASTKKAPGGKKAKKGEGKGKPAPSGPARGSEAALKNQAAALANWDDEDFFSEEEEEGKSKDKDLELQQEKAANAEEEKNDPLQQEATRALASEAVEGINQDNIATTKALVAVMPHTSDSQKDAIISSMSSRVTIVQGPPGTGKTHTSVRIITNWVKTMGYKPLLATSECNVAVDNIAEGLVANGVKVVRIGRCEKVSVRLDQAVLVNLIKEGRRKAREEGDESEDDEADFDNIGDEPADWNSWHWTEWQRKRQARWRHVAWDRKKDKFMKEKILREAEVICATTITSGSPQLSGFKFHGILIDEVAQATETSSIVPIITRGAQQLVLCGDHCQLPPSVQSREAELRGYSLSLYSRLVESGVPFRFLDTQYRAHPQLMEFSASCIYHGKLKSGIDGSERPQPLGIPWPSKKCPAAFFECGVEEHLEGESKANEAEAKMVRKLVQGVIDKGDIGVGDIGIVTPYKGQVRVLRRVMEKLKLPPGETAILEMASVDNFQGREKELIIFTAVRCNDHGSVGFLSDWRRLNVMITRARRGLVIVGSAETLCHDPHWKLWLEFTEKQGGCPKGTVRKAIEAEGKRLEADFALELLGALPVAVATTTTPTQKEKETTWSASEWAAWGQETPRAEVGGKPAKKAKAEAEAEDSAKRRKTAEGQQKTPEWEAEDSAKRRKITEGQQKWTPNAGGSWDSSGSGSGHWSAAAWSGTDKSSWKPKDQEWSWSSARS
ncbi:unnamed protein product [Polarella glacialis]|uniref:RNA helicase n=1 Tax=Polarella glacialis TaxID=89957 RepID=A0A813L579_POLGL|nr:unnamed protein product [Polarella glacialis]